MALLIYHHHTIVSTPIYDDETGKWKCVASISWAQSKGLPRQMHSIQDCFEPFSRYEDAENAGLEAAKNWVESRASKRLRVS
jgi:hypothetical protein